MYQEVSTVIDLDENEVYWIDKNTAVMIHLANEPTGQRNGEGQLIDNIVNKGWYVFKGEPGKMIPVRKLSANDKVDDEIWRKLDGN